MADVHHVAFGQSLSTILRRGLRGRCPRCGKASVFKGLLDIVPECAECGLNLSGHDAGDGPAVAGIFVLGFGLAGAAVAVELMLEPPLWVHVVVWGPAVLAGTIAVLRPLKGLTVALQYRYRSVDKPSLPGGQ